MPHRSVFKQCGLISCWQPLTTAISPLTLLIISRVPWAGAHQEGATVGKGVTLPERAHIYVTAPFLDWVLPKIADHMGITRRMVKRYVAKGYAEMRERMAPMLDRQEMER